MFSTIPRQMRGDNNDMVCVKTTAFFGMVTLKRKDSSAFNFQPWMTLRTSGVDMLPSSFEK